ncbi:unnamed protein product [Caenorhabditis nigoni]
MVNLRLRSRGHVQVKFLHRDSNGLRGIPQISRWNSNSCQFYWAEYNCNVSVYEYFFIKYGFEIRRPYDPLIFWMHLLMTSTLRIRQTCFLLNWYEFQCIDNLFHL